MSVSVCPKCGYQQPGAGQCPRCGLVISRYREKPVRPTAPRINPAGPGKARVFALVLGAVALFVLLVVSALVFITSLIKRSEPYRMTEALVTDSDAIRAVVGANPRLGYWVSGSVETSGDGDGTAQLRADVHGAEGSTKVYAVLRRQQGQWAFRRADYRDSDGAARSLLGSSTAEAGAQSPQPQKPPGARAHLEAAHELYRQNNFAAALAEYDKAVGLDPFEPDAYYWRGAAAFKLGQMDRALADFNECIRRDPKRVEAYQFVDSILAPRGAWDEIIASWTGLIDLDPGNARAYLERGGTYFRKGDLRSALRDAEKACELGNQAGCGVVAKYTPGGR